MVLIWPYLCQILAHLADFAYLEVFHDAFSGSALQKCFMMHLKLINRLHLTLSAIFRKKLPKIKESSVN